MKAFFSNLKLTKSVTATVCALTIIVVTLIHALITPLTAQSYLIDLLGVVTAFILISFFNLLRNKDGEQTE